NMREALSRILKLREIARSTSRKPGASRKLRGEFPSTNTAGFAGVVPAAGVKPIAGFCAKALVLNQAAALGLARCGSPTTWARSLLVPSRFASAPFEIVNGNPLRSLMIGDIDQPLTRSRRIELPPL